MIDSDHEVARIKVEPRIYEPFTLDELVAAAKLSEIWKSCAQNFQEEFNDLESDGEMEGPSVKEATPSDIKKLVGRKSYYAGTSARWMFQYDTAYVRNAIGRHVLRVTNVNDLANGAVGAMNNIGVNHLMAPTADPDYPGFAKYRIVSQYALDVLMKLVPFQRLGFESAYAIFNNDEPQATGWLVELDYVSQVKTTSEVLLGKKTFPDKLTQEEVDKVKFNRTFVEPEASNQAAFDLMQVIEAEGGVPMEEPIRIIQMTQVTTQKEDKPYNATKILKDVVKVAAKLKLSPSRLAIRVITMMPRSVLPDKTAFKPNVTALELVYGEEDYNATIMELAPKSRENAFREVAEDFDLQNISGAMTLATLYDEDKIREHLKNNVDTFKLQDGQPT